MLNRPGAVALGASRRMARIAALWLFGCGLVLVVLGFGVARADATPRPQLNRTIELLPVSGQVRFGATRARTAPLGAPTVVSVPTVVDARHGTVRVISAIDRGGATQSAEFDGGEFTATQPVDYGGILQVRLIDNGLGACHGASAAGANHGQPGVHLHVRNGYGPGGTRVIGKNGSGESRLDASEARSAHVVSWEIVDRCKSTAIIDHVGDLTTAGRIVPVSFGLTADDTISYRCATARPASRSYCAVIRGPVSHPRGVGRPVSPFILTLVTDSPHTASYALNVLNPDHSGSPVAYPLPPPDRQGYRRSDVACVPDAGAGTYQATWQIGRTTLATIDYAAPAGSPPQTPQCTSNPYTRHMPADLTDTAPSPKGDVLVHYTTDTDDVADATNGAAARAVAAIAERMLNYDKAALGMPSYVNDGDRRLDIYIEGQTSAGAQTVLVPHPGTIVFPLPGYPAAVFLTLPPSQVGDMNDIAQIVFGAQLNAIGRLVGLEPTALPYSIKTWAASNFLQQAVTTPALSEPLDCGTMCPSYAAHGQWRFYEHLSEQFGDGIIPAILRQVAADDRGREVSHMDAALTQVLAAHGTTLATQLSGYALEDLANDWAQPWVRTGDFAYTTDGSQLTIGADAGPVSGLPSPVVRHLASRYLQITVPSLAPCVEDALSIDVDYPAGGSVPGVASFSGEHPSVIASTSAPSGAEVVVPFDSCAGAVVRVPFVNTTTTDDALSFNVAATLSRGAVDVTDSRRTGDGRAGRARARSTAAG